MKTYKIKQGNKLLQPTLKNPKIVYNQNINTIDNCIQSLNTTIDVQHTTTGTKIGEVGQNDIYLPELDADVTVESAVYFNTLDHLKTSGALELKNGDVARTKGFYSPNDGGGGTYLIRTSLATRVNGYAQENIKVNDYKSRYIYSTPLVDGVTLLQLSDTLYAELVIEEGTFVNLRQVGGRPLEDGVKIDNSEALDKAITFMKRKKYFRSVYIPSGHWCFSNYIIQNKIHTSAGYEGLKLFGDGFTSICMPFNDSQYYIFRVGTYDSSDIPGNETRGGEVSNLTFQCGNYDLSPELKALYGADKYVTTAAIFVQNATYSTFKELTFKYVFNTCMVIVSDYESHFELIRFHCCGGVRNSKVYPVIQLDKSGYSYASSVSANWFTFLHFDSCVGPYIYGGAQNNGHNEFNCVLVTGDMNTYNQACPDVNSEQTDETVVKWGVIDNYQGMTNFWPNVYGTVVCSTFNNEVIRDGVKYKMNSILHHEASNHCHVYLGNVIMPLSSNGSGPWVTYNTADALNYSVKQLFDEKEWPYYCSSKYLPKTNVQIRDPRLIYSTLNGANPVSKYTRSTLSENPIHLITVGNSASDQTIFLAKAGKRYALKIYKEPVSDGVWLNTQFNTKYKTGLWVYKSGWIPVGDLKSTTLLGSDGNWRYVLIDNFFCFKDDTLVRISGGGYEFVYEQKSYPKGLLNLTLNSNNITSAKGTSATYTITKDSSISTVTASAQNSRYFSVSVSGNTLTLTTKLSNTNSKNVYTYIMLTGKDSEGNTITKTSFLSVYQPVAT